MPMASQTATMGLWLKYDRVASPPGSCADLRFHSQPVARESSRARCQRAGGSLEGSVAERVRHQGNFEVACTANVLPAR